MFSSQILERLAEDPDAWTQYLQKKGRDNHHIANDRNVFITLGLSPTYRGRFTFDEQLRLTLLDGWPVKKDDIYEAMLFCQARGIQASKCVRCNRTHSPWEPGHRGERYGC